MYYQLHLMLLGSISEMVANIGAVLLISEPVPNPPHQQPLTLDCYIRIG